MLDINPAPPWQLHSSTLGLSEGIDVRFLDGTGSCWETESVEFVLRNIDSFADKRDQMRLLYTAAVHYGFEDTWTLILGREPAEPRYDLFDDAGRLLLADVTHEAAWCVTQQLEKLPGWASGFRYVLQRSGQARAGLLWDWRHEGPLVLMDHSLGIDNFPCLFVRSHVGGCCVMLEEVLRRLDQFSDEDQARLLSALEQHFGFTPLSRTVGHVAEHNRRAAKLQEHL